MKEYILEAHNVYFQYEDGTEALRGISLGIEKGKKTVVLGHNGAGKSTLFLHFNGIYRPERGEIRFAGEKVLYGKSFLKKLRKNVGIVFQDPDTQLFSANVFQEISFGPLNLGLSKKETYEKVFQAMEETGITHLKDRPTHLLSYGEKKRVAIADVLAMDPEVIILDEPTAWLDPISTRQTLKLLDKINAQGKTLLLSTHDVDLAYSWADHIILMKEGEVVGEGTPETVFADENLLQKAGMVRPWILEIYGKLREKGWINGTHFPRTKQELLDLIEFA
ncbi:energy-coupling factor ABC transporter ATP-binding protein [Calderihabitans maritimus]|uniref:ABC transporter ATP-binding protein n=1 Tax=Calderihabitans maritimus TaxID=1246530 RepID=A0A1Z5HVV1_9FIRM|nr:ATP-binding cassette domain-containing protein [Calderihabitans maritimus]GAW93467.1 cobalt ABC transporter ATPase [Calderihabitans maritimus]